MPSVSVAPAPPTTRGGALRAFAYPDYRFLLVGTMGSQLGDWIQTVGLGWLVLMITHSPAQLGILAFVRGMAMLVITPFGGVIADRVSRRRLLVVATAVGAISATVVAVLVVTGLIAVWELYLTAIVDGTVASINWPARQVMVYDVVGGEDLTNAIALNAIGNNLSRIIGPSAGGLLIAVTGVAGCFFGQAACYLIASGATFLIRTEGRASRAKEPVLSSLGAGVRYAVRRPVVLTLLVIAMLPSLFVYPYLSFMPVFATDVLHAGSLGYGILLTGVGFGSIVGAAAIAALPDFRYKGWATLIASGLYMSMVAAFALSRLFLLAFGFLVVAGVFNTVYFTFNQTLLQWNIEDAFRGRVLALYLTGGNVTPIGALVIGFLVAAWGAPPVIAGSCMIAILCMIGVTLFAPHLRRL